MTLTHTAILTDLKNKIFHPIYLLEGEEPYYIDLISNYIENNILPESERAFNQTILYGKDTTAVEIRQRALNYPMFSNYQVLMVKEAQLLKKWEALENYVLKPVKSTILVICYKYENFDKRTRVGKAIRDNGVLMTTKKLFENQVPQWIHEFLKEKNYNIQPEAAALVVEYVGNELSKVSNELEKLMLNVSHKKDITAEDVETNIGISKEYNVFELNKALAIKDVTKANRIVYNLSANARANPFALTLGSLYSYFSKVYLLQQSGFKNDADIASLLRLSPYVIKEYKTAVKNFSAIKIQQIFSLLHDYDLRSKGVNDTGAKEGALLTELVFKILH
ncbi:MAG: DNA polymerase III subunit delta [Chitinophagales bacterium]|nr:DNA polymerase III subunit delta [Chitinophagales bacterium]